METIRYQAHPPMFRNRPVLFVLSVLLIAAFGLGLLILMWWFVVSRSQTLTITDDELRYEQGILSKARSELRLTSIRSVRVNQTLGQRIFGTGDVEIFTAGDMPEVTLQGMPEPNRIRELT
ncbi:MAG TPA: PH domain-containing protein [Devosiaceae bacterium]|nr:PH domain-containing protein [Devosiaceae bacterium]